MGLYGLSPKQGQAVGRSAMASSSPPEMGRGRMAVDADEGALTLLPFGENVRSLPLVIYRDGDARK